MRDDLIKRYDMKLTDVGKYNLIWECDNWVMIWNKTNGQIKLKPKDHV